MDEIGRGTSTYDGLSLAQAILEYLVAEKKPYLFFATHYQELTKLSGVWPQMGNAHMSVSERRGEIGFLYTLKEGPANRSYGIHVARLAEVPSAMNLHAEKLLKAFEDRGPNSQQLTLTPIAPSGEPTPAPDPLLEEIRNVNVSSMAQLDALNMINKWQRKLT